MRGDDRDREPEGRGGAAGAAGGAAAPGANSGAAAAAGAAAHGATATPPLLAVEGLSVRYGGVLALDAVDLSVGRGQLVTVIGANGAGKSSLVNAVVGVVPKAGGRVLVDGEDVTRSTPEALVGRGVVLVPERRELFAALSVDDNLRLGAYRRYLRGERDLRASLDEVYATFPQLGARRRQLAGTMSGGEQQMLAIGRAMMARPRLLLLDEPSLGLAPLIVEEIFRVVGALRDAGATVLLIEQNARAALRLADHGYLLETGTVLLSAPAAELARDERVASAYLGR